MEVLMMLLAMCQWGSYWWLDGYEHFIFTDGGTDDEEIHAMVQVDSAGINMARICSCELYDVAAHRGTWTFMHQGLSPYWEEDRREHMRDVCHG